MVDRWEVGRHDLGDYIDATCDKDTHAAPESWESKKSGLEKGLRKKLLFMCKHIPLVFLAA